VSGELPDPPAGMVWLRFAVPVPETVVGAWDSTPAKVRWDLESEVRDAARETLRQIMGHPVVIGDTSS